MPKRLMINGLSPEPADMDGIAVTEMHLVAHREGIPYTRQEGREVMIAKLMEAGIIWDEDVKEK